MATLIYKTSLFDFDFSEETETRNATEEAHRNFPADLRDLRDESFKPHPWEIERPETRLFASEIPETLDRLRALADAALMADRMEAYFRLLDEIEAYEAELSAMEEEKTELIH